MKRQTPLSAAHRRTISLTHKRSRGIILFLNFGSFKKNTPAVFICHFPSFNTRCFHYFLHTPHPHSTAALLLPSANDFLYLTVTNWHANFPTSEPWTSSPPRFFSLVSFLHLADLGQTPHILCRSRGDGGGGGMITWPLYLISRLSKGIFSLQTAPCDFHHNSAAKPHKRGGNM